MILPTNHHLALTISLKYLTMGGGSNCRPLDYWMLFFLWRWKMLKYFNTMKFHKTSSWHEFWGRPHHLPCHSHVTLYHMSCQVTTTCHFKKGPLGHPKRSNPPTTCDDHGVSHVILYTSLPHVIISLDHVISLWPISTTLNLKTCAKTFHLLLTSHSFVCTLFGLRSPIRTWVLGPCNLWPRVVTRGLIILLLVSPCSPPIVIVCKSNGEGGLISD